MSLLPFPQDLQGPEIWSTSVVAPSPPLRLCPASSLLPSLLEAPSAQRLGPRFHPRGSAGLCSVANPTHLALSTNHRSSKAQGPPDLGLLPLWS